MSSSVSVQTKINKLRKLQVKLDDITGKQVRVGYKSGSEQAAIAAVHEFGCRIRVTPKMRAYLHRQGLHLKKSTEYIVIPERSFLRAGFDKHNGAVMDKTSALLKDLLFGSMSAEAFAYLVGLMMSSKIKEYAVGLSAPANSPFTVARKGSSNPLVDSGDMINALEFDWK